MNPLLRPRRQTCFGSVSTPSLLEQLKRAREALAASNAAAAAIRGRARFVAYYDDQNFFDKKNGDKP